MNIGIALKRIRSALDLTQADLADLTGISAPMISYIEKGIKQPSEETIDNLVAVLNITREQLRLIAAEDLSKYEGDLRTLAKLGHDGVLGIIGLQYQARKSLGMLAE